MQIDSKKFYFGIQIDYHVRSIVPWNVRLKFQGWPYEVFVASTYLAEMWNLS